MIDPSKSPRTPCFEPGAKVRVKSNVRDPDFPDIPLGGWTGTVKEVDRSQAITRYLIAWDRSTLRGIHPIYKKRCERDGLELELMWLDGESLEADDGVSAVLEQPTSIVTRPLSEKDQDDRVRKVFGLTHDDPLPEVSSETLLAYHGYLAANLTFPFRARYDKQIGRFEWVKMPLDVTGLLRPDECEIAEEYGIVATGQDAEESVDLPLHEVEVKESSPSCRLVRDYSHWFHNGR